jgi:TorA maturation chaperone TorD
MSAPSWRERADAYALAARLFGLEIDAELLERLRRVAIPTAPELGDAPAEEVVHELAVEYCRLFVGPQPECPPYASIHRSEALLGGKARARLEPLLQRSGLAFGEGAPIASVDHLSVQLGLLAEIYERLASSADAELLGLARELLERHVLPWAPAYLAQLELCARLEPYRFAAQMTAALLAAERESLAQ